jgi:hypothetical protein
MLEPSCSQDWGGTPTSVCAQPVDQALSAATSDVDADVRAYARAALERLSRPFAEFGRDADLGARSRSTRR